MDREKPKIEIVHADCLDHMKTMADNSIDFIVTDSPYGISFMSNHWDEQIPPIEYWAEMLRICKPGSMMAAAGLPRMYHRLACIIEDAGWRIKDCVLHIFGTGFPKAMNFGKKLGGQWEGYASCGLKPAYEPWIIAEKPIEKNYAFNAEKWGVAGINIDSSRIQTTDYIGRNSTEYPKQAEGWGLASINKPSNSLGRWPSNLILSEEAAAQLDQMTGISKSNPNPRKNGKTVNCYGKYNDFTFDASHLNDSGGASRFFKCIENDDVEKSRFFYCPKSSTAERQCSKHPTIKPQKLIEYLIKLLAPPGNPICLDPFMGSGTCGIVCKRLGINFIGIEKELEYFEDAKRRIDLVDAPQYDLFDSNKKDSRLNHLMCSDQCDELQNL